MQTNQLRRELAFGASIAALCVAMPAIGQAVPGAMLPDTYSVGVTETYEFGVTTTGADPSASVVDIASGEVAQVSDSAEALSLENNGDVSVAASASGTGTASAVVGNVGQDVTATGTYQAGITQKHLLPDAEEATWDASASLVNTGDASVSAIAVSSDGDASTRILGGIAQAASVETKGQTANGLIDNSGTAAVSAAATGAGAVTASVGTGGETGAPAVRQFVFSAKGPDAVTTGTGTILNSGTLNVLATATPAATGADSASASVPGGVVQQVQATGRGNSDLTATVTNDGTFNFVSSAGVGEGSATTATAFATEVLTQRIQANGGGLQTDSVEGWNDMLAVAMTNTGDINLTTTAEATETATSLIGVKAVPANFGQYAAMYGQTYGEGEGLNAGYQNFGNSSPILSEHGVISQRGQANGWGDDLSEVTMTNAAGGAITIAATATAANSNGDATANNTAALLIAQGTQANGTGNDTATAAMTNAGAINVNVAGTASSTAESGDAFAVSTITSAIGQTAEVTGPTKFIADAGGGAGAGGALFISIKFFCTQKCILHTQF